MSQNISRSHKELIIGDFSRLKFTSKYDDFMQVSDFDLSDKLDSIRSDMLILVGEKDKTISPRRSRQLGKGKRTSSVQVVLNASHYPHLENVEMTAFYLGNFLSQKYV